MAGRSLRNLVNRRRRGAEEGEEEEDGPVVVEDSQSEGSVLTEMSSDDADAEDIFAEPGDNTAPTTASSVPEGQTSNGTLNGLKGTKKRKSRKKPAKRAVKEVIPANGNAQSSFKSVADTEAMQYGLQVDEGGQGQQSLDFESIGQSTGSNGHATSHGEEQRRDHQAHRKPRDTNPAFIPNRGGFYMHDSRPHGGASGPQPARGGAWQGKGKGRGAVPLGGPFAPSTQMEQTASAAEGPWKHDLHDTINEEPAALARPVDTPQGDADESSRLFGRPTPAQDRSGPSPVISFNTTTLMGKVNLRVHLPGMAAPISFSEVPVKRYTRLPNHRPPLRRDKPVRISLPDNPPRYIFPSPDRSFIFIPRQMRPNQQGFGRYLQQNRNAGGYGYSSRRTSIFGGSIYSGSVAPSRRPSITSQFGREPVFSPPVSVVSGFQPPAYRPVVRMPPTAQLYSGATTPSQQYSGYHTPTMPPMTNFPPPQQPTYQGTPTTTVHQPRPQKAISVSGIDSPAALQQASQPLEPQPFQNQLPEHMNQPPPAFNHPQQYFPPGQNYAYPPQSHINTPLGGIPENAINAQVFQPMGLQFGPPFYPPYQPPGGIPTGVQPGYAPGARNAFGSIPMFPPTFGMSQPSLQPPSEPQPAQETGPSQHPRPHHQQSHSQSGFVASERNGMVFYTPADQVQGQDQGSQSYQPAETFTPSYAMPPGGGSGGFYTGFQQPMEAMQDPSQPYYAMMAQQAGQQ